MVKRNTHNRKAVATSMSAHRRDSRPTVLFDCTTLHQQLRLVDLPESVIISQIFPFLRLADLARASILCNRFLANCGKHDALWKKQWRRTEAKRRSYSDARTDFPVPTYLKGKLYLLCCKEQNRLFYKKLEDLRKKRQIAISTCGPVNSLRDFILHEMNKGKQDDTKLFITIVNFNHDDNKCQSQRQRVPSTSYPFDASLKATTWQIPLVNVARKMQSQGQVRTTRSESYILTRNRKA